MSLMPRSLLGISLPMHHSSFAHDIRVTAFIRDLDGSLTNLAAAA